MIAPFTEPHPGVFPVYFAVNPDDKVVKNRWHFDLAPVDQAAEVARLRVARRAPRRHRSGGGGLGGHGRRRGQRVLRAPLAPEGGSGMKVSFVAGFGPIIREADAAHAFWRDGLGIAFEEPAPGYFTNDDLDGVKAFAMWPLSQAAEATFGRGRVAGRRSRAAGVDRARRRVGRGRRRGRRGDAGRRPSPAARGARGAVGPDDLAAAVARGPARRHHLHAVDARARTPSRRGTDHRVLTRLSLRRRPRAWRPCGPASWPGSRRGPPASRRRRASGAPAAPPPSRAAGRRAA